MSIDKYTGAAYPKTCKLLKDNHIAPEDVVVEGVSLAGYFTFNRDKNAKRILNRFGFNKTWHEWSRPELGEKVIETMAKDRP
jgi:hypothetical protein